MKSFSIRWFAFCMFGLFVVSCGPKKGTLPTGPTAVENKAAKSQDEGKPLHAEVTVFVSTRCPYAAETLRALLEIKKKMGSAMALHIGYLGTVDAEGNIDRRVGDDEIASAAAQICVGMSATETSWYDFLECIYEGDIWRTFPQGMELCTAKTGIDRTDVEACIRSGEGEKYLAKAYAAAAASRIEASPTIIVNRHFYAGDRNATALMQYLCYTAGTEETRPASCDGVAPPPKIEAVMLYDLRCKSALKCDVEGEVAVLEKLIPGFALERLEFATEKGRALYDRIVAAEPKARELPVIFIDGAVDDQESLRDVLGEYLIPFEDGYLFALGGGWDPLAEICDNGLDDNNDGAVDCADKACGSERTCREEKKGRLDLFIMSGCPYAIDLLPDVDALLDHFGRDKKALDFHLQFIGDLDENGALNSMHGEEEVAEDLRMICAEALAPEKYKFMEYVLCRAKNFESTDWAACVPKGMNKAKLKACAEGKQGEDMLKASFALAAALGVAGSPSWVLNNRDDMEARSLPDMVVEYCQKNETAACKVPLKEMPAEEKSAPSPSHQCGEN